MLTQITNYFLKPKKNLLLEVFLFLLIVFIILIIFFVQRNQLASQEICNLLRNNYLENLSDKEYDRCLNLNSRYEFSDSKKIENFNEWFSGFHISHLYIYNSKENQKMWQGESVETGIIAKLLFGKWKVNQLLVKDSQVKVGDEILSINGRKVVSASQILYTQGRFKVLREKKKLEVQVKFSDVYYDERLFAKSIDDQWSYLKIPSFKAENFGYDELSLIYEKLKSKNLVVDVRDNLGGNFVAMLRIVSMLKCEDKQVGLIFHNRQEFQGEEILVDDLSDDQQIFQVNNNNPVYLNLFRTELCLNPGKIVVLMNRQTASVSELFVQILKEEYENLKVIGSTSAGQMVLSIWYSVKHLGPGVMVSVPYAWATANDKEILEGQGVSPTIDIGFEQVNKFPDSLDPLLEHVWESEGVRHTLTQDDESKAPASLVNGLKVNSSK